MYHPAALILRAFELAQTGRFSTASAVRCQLHSEGCSDDALRTHFDSFATRHALSLIV
jgi:hypothetical protein